MSEKFYDNQQKPYEANPIYTVVERVYCFDFNQFLESHWQELGQIYPLLPGWQGYQRNIPYWFGLQDETPPNLSASVEPPGLQVYGQVIWSEWVAWDGQFRAKSERFPTYRL